MTKQRDIQGVLDAWLREGSTVAPDRVIDVVADRIEGQRQRGGWRFPTWETRMPATVRLAAVAAALAVVAAGAIYFAGSSRPSVAPPSPGPSPTVAASTKPSPSPYVLPPGLPYPTARTITSTEARPGFQFDVPTGWTGESSNVTLGLIHSDDFGDYGHVGGSISLRRNPVLASVTTACPDQRTAPPTPGPAMPASAMVEALLADPRFSVVASAAITIDGRTAQVLDVHLAPGYAGTCIVELGPPSALLFDEPGSFVVLDGDQRVRVILLDIDNVPLLILIWPDEEAFDAFIARSMPIVETLKFLP